MITRRSVTKNWIEQIRKEHPRKDPLLIERMIRALVLVESLKLSGLEFTFKGGTAVSVLLENVYRFSIDIDIVIEEEVDLGRYFDRVVSLGGFLRWEEDVREGVIPKQHFKFYFPGVVQEKEFFVLLDVLYEENQYFDRKEVVLSSDLLEQEEPLTRLLCPTIPALLGDKMTAFAPNTTGVRYSVGKDLEIAKQLFDIALLFDHTEDLEVVSKTFRQIANQELKYRNILGKEAKHALLDILDTATLIGVRGADFPQAFSEILSGIRKLNGYVLSGSFTIEKGIVCASKASFLAASLLTNQKQLVKYDQTIDMRRWEFESPNPTRLNKLKKTNPEAFFYFMKAYELLRRN